ncbi:GNAT family N-acetyltransferase [Hymenobacter terricola]|uniref:GNAT family N-acetyltransferase n=1 Tax=Hymenobacter terricola TaxID=2819236 RepID=UPI001B3095AE|nr:GNAT family N-acetyltransferase [Hymenobacter terricola]
MQDHPPSAGQRPLATTDLTPTPPSETIRPVVPADLPALLTLTEAVGLFTPEELAGMHAQLTRYFAGTADPDEYWIADDDHGLAGVAYYALERMTEGTWNLYFIGVHPHRRREGRAAALLRYVEATLAARGERLLLIETSGDAAQEPARALYRRAGYDEEARIREFYAAGTDKLVFRKALTNQAKPAETAALR